MDKNKENVPKIRFPEFDGPWQQHKLGELYEKVSEKNDLSYGEDKIISVANMYFKSEVCVTNKEYLRTYNVFKLGDIAFEGNKSKKFLHGRFVENTIGDGIVSHVFDVFRPLMMQYDLSFWKYMINNESVMAKILIRSTKASTMMTNLVAKDFIKEYIRIPSFQEQEKIGIFLNNLDNLITLHQRKLEHLQDKKKGLLQKMFPKEGEKFPELRFPGFDDPWEQRKLGEICEEFQSGKNIKAEYIKENGAYPVYGGNGLRGYSDTYNHDGIYALIGRQGALCGNMNISSGKAYFTEHAIAVRANKSSETRFLFYLLGKMNLGQYSGQSAQPGLAVNKLLELSSSVPNYDEQKQISEFFVLLDHLITLHQRKLERLQQQKKGLLQQMFI